MTLRKQIVGFWRNFIAALIRLKPPDFLPPSIKDLIAYIFLSVKYAFGLEGEPYHQVGSSIALMIVAFLSSLLTAGLTLVFVALFGLTLFIGIIRWTPAINTLWTRFRPPMARLYDRFVDLVWRWDI